uniref:Uncharacterized protein n=1 Tax=Rhizobium rhizogenes TaxID=359 RepID=A0A7S5DRM0_RHIRH|nr:hypothetical protein pC5.8b_481 [Rhizobium rhizogenes]
MMITPAHIATNLTDMGIWTRHYIVRALRKAGTARHYVDRWQLPCFGLQVLQSP